MANLPACGGRKPHRRAGGKSIDDVARISLQDEPDFPGRTKIKRAGGAEGKMHFESGSRVDFADHGDAALLD